MKYLFASILAFLVAASVSLRVSFPDTSAAVPVIYWVTDPNPARDRQVELFHQWLVEHGHVTADGKPAAELRLDNANNRTEKKVIQGVSGVAGDIWDVYGGAPQMTYFQAIGLLEDVTDAASRLRYGPDATYPALESDITIDGRQYLFPCNVTAPQFWVNEATFARFGQPLPPKRWTFEEFERLGKQFVAAANPPGQRQEYFYHAGFDRTTMHRSMGLSSYNETLTRCTLDDERFVECLRLFRKWTYDDHILPSESDRASFDTQSGYGGSIFQLFNRGNYAMVQSGRYALIQFRKFGAMDLTVVEFPHGGFPVTTIATRAAGIYILGQHKELAKLFQAYLASETYNMQIVADADALPPSPKYALTEAFLRPKDYPNEWGCHEAFYNAAMTIAVGNSVSPYVLDTITTRHTNDAFQAVMSGRLTPREAATQVATRVNAEIRRSTEEDPRVKEHYGAAVERQQQIDALRAEGKPVPLEWIANPFYRSYYKRKGWLTP